MINLSRITCCAICCSQTAYWNAIINRWIDSTR